MKRISKKVLQKRRWVTWSICICTILIALLVLFSPELFPPPTYDELSEKSITLSSYERIHQYRGYSYRLYSKDNEAFTITGDFDTDEASAVFQSGVIATVKWYPNPINPFLDCVEEVTVNGKAIVRYNNDDPIDRTPLIMISVLIILVGAGYTVCSLLWTKHLQNLEDKRDKRIEMKYGSKKAIRMTTIYFVRHARPNYGNHNDLERELTAKGLEDRKRVTAFLMDKSVDVVLSSPYKRAVDTVKDFADRAGLAIGIVPDFRERKVESVWIDDFEGFCKQQWADFTYKLSDGESLEEVQDRNIAALREVLKAYKDKTIVIGTHGTALSTILNYYDPSFGYDGFQRIRRFMPWIVKLTFDGERLVGIREYDMFEG